jgi:hypothetical protein
MSLNPKELYPKLPPLKATNIEWDDDPDWQPHPASGVFRTQTLRLKAQNISGVQLDSEAVKQEMP